MPRKLPALATVARALVGGVRTSYEHLGLTAIHSAIWFFAHIPYWWTLVWILSNVVAGAPGVKLTSRIDWRFIFVANLLTGAFLAAPANAAMMYVIRLIREDEARVRDFFIGFKRHYWRTVAIYSSFLTVVAILLANMAAAIRIQVWVTRISLALALYFLIFVLLLSNYFFPLLVLQPNGFRKVWKKAFLLTLDNGFLTLVLSLLTLALYLVSGGFSILLVLFYPAAMGHSHYHLFSSLLAKYDEVGGSGKAQGMN